MTQTPRQRSARRVRLADRAKSTALWKITPARQAMEKLPDIAFEAGRADVAADLFIRIERGLLAADSDSRRLDVLYETREYLSEILDIVSPAGEEKAALIAAIPPWEHLHSDTHYHPHLDGRREHSHMGGGLPHAHDPSGFQVRTDGTDFPEGEQ